MAKNKAKFNSKSPVVYNTAWLSKIGINTSIGLLVCLVLTAMAGVLSFMKCDVNYFVNGGMGAAAALLIVLLINLGLIYGSELKTTAPSIVFIIVNAVSIAIVLPWGVIIGGLGISCEIQGINGNGSYPLDVKECKVAGYGTLCQDRNFTGLKWEPEDNSVMYYMLNRFIHISMDIIVMVCCLVACCLHGFLIFAGFKFVNCKKSPASSTKKSKKKTDGLSGMPPPADEFGEPARGSGMESGMVTADPVRASDPVLSPGLDVDPFPDRHEGGADISGRSNASIESGPTGLENGDITGSIASDREPRKRSKTMRRIASVEVLSSGSSSGGDGEGDDSETAYGCSALDFQNEKIAEAVICHQSTSHQSNLGEAAAVNGCLNCGPDLSRSSSSMAVSTQMHSVEAKCSNLAFDEQMLNIEADALNQSIEDVNSNEKSENVLSMEPIHDSSYNLASLFTVCEIGDGESKNDVRIPVE